jgi:hypothetical protein
MASNLSDRGRGHIAQPVGVDPHALYRTGKSSTGNAREALALLLVTALLSLYRLPTRVVDMAGLLPGTCDMDLVREVKSPSCCTLVLLADLLHVPSSHAFALDCDRSICGFWRILVSDLTLPLTAAALPAPPTTDEVPALPVELAPRPIVEAEVPPAAALPAVPIVELPSWAASDPTVCALGWARAPELASANAPTIAAICKLVTMRLLSRIDSALLA